MLAKSPESAHCAGCDETITTPESLMICPVCSGHYHRSCWDADRGCHTPGCPAAPRSIASQAQELEQSVVKTTSLVSYMPWMIGAGVILLLIVAAFSAVWLRVPVNTVLIIAVIIAALTFDYVNGMHDAGNAIATVISTRVLTPAAALLMAAVLNLAGAMLFSGVAKSIATKFAAPGVDVLTITPLMILCGLIGASAWSFWTARIGLPVSTSHSLFGGLIGVFLLGGIKLNFHYMLVLGMWIVLAPLMAFSVGWLLMTVINYLFRHSSPFKLNQHFRVLQVISSALMAFSHGSNDAQKAMGIITLALISGGFLAGGPHVEVPIWVKIACALVIALGTGLGGMRVIKTLGHKIIKLDPVHGFTAETVAAATIQVVTLLHVPISTTHVISSSILGIGASKRLSAVRWSTAVDIVSAWFFTIPTCAIAGAGLYWVVSHLIGMK